MRVGEEVCPVAFQLRSAFAFPVDLEGICTRIAGREEVSQLDAPSKEISAGPPPQVTEVKVDEYRVATRSLFAYLESCLAFLLRMNARFSHFECVKILLQNRADPNLASCFLQEHGQLSSTGHNSVHEASLWIAITDVLSLLLKHRGGQTLRAKHHGRVGGWGGRRFVMSCLPKQCFTCMGL